MAVKEPGAAKKSLGEKPWDISVSLHVIGFQGSPDVISRILGIDPTRVWVQGEPVKTGKLVTKLVRKENHWILDAPCTRTASLQEQMGSLLRTVSPISENFDRLPSGTVVRLSCAICDHSRSVALVFEPSVIQALARIRAELDIDYYDLASDDE